MSSPTEDRMIMFWVLFLSGSPLVALAMYYITFRFAGRITGVCGIVCWVFFCWFFKYIPPMWVTVPPLAALAPLLGPTLSRATASASLPATFTQEANERPAQVIVAFTTTSSAQLSDPKINRLRRGAYTLFCSPLNSCWYVVFLVASMGVVALHASGLVLLGLPDGQSESLEVRVEWLRGRVNLRLPCNHRLSANGTYLYYTPDLAQRDVEMIVNVWFQCFMFGPAYPATLSFNRSWPYGGVNTIGRSVAPQVLQTGIALLSFDENTEQQGNVRVWEPQPCQEIEPTLPCPPYYSRALIENIILVNVLAVLVIVSLWTVHGIVVGKVPSAARKAQ